MRGVLEQVTFYHEGTAYGNLWRVKKSEKRVFYVAGRLLLLRRGDGAQM